MANPGKTIALLGVVGIGGYVAYQYMQYQAAMHTIDQADPTGATTTNIQNILPFTSYLMAWLSPPPQGTPQANALLAIHAALSGHLSQAAQTTPGTSATTGQPSTTTISTAPTTTPSTTSTVPSTPQPTATDLQHALNATAGSADQWNFAFRELTGYGIEQMYGGNFDAIYGPIQSNGQRATGTITAQAFLTLPQSEGIAPTVVSGMHGLGRFGAIARFYTPVVNPMGSMVYRAQHPSPYRLPVSGGLMGLGAMTQATGFEKALWAGGFIRSRRIQ